MNIAWSDVIGPWHDEQPVGVPRVKPRQCAYVLCGYWFRPEPGDTGHYCTAECGRLDRKLLAALAKNAKPKPSRPGKQTYQVTPEQACEVVRLRADGVKPRAIAQRYGVSRDYVSKLCCGIIHGEETAALRAELRLVRERTR